MKRQNTPHAKYTTLPFVNGFTDIEKENSTLIIGLSTKDDDIFNNTPEYVSVICKISVRSDFPDVTISAGYRTSPSGSDLLMKKKLYDNSEISMKNMISEIDIEFVNWQTNPESLEFFHLETPLLYRKTFKIQNVSKRIPNYPDNSEEQSGIFMTKSEAHPFAGFYFDGIRLSDIQPYLFYIGTDFRTTPYIKVISAQEALRSHKIKLHSEITDEMLSTLEDDIFNGKLRFELGGTKYRSIFAQKNTLTSNLFQVSFKKEN